MSVSGQSADAPSEDPFPAPAEEVEEGEGERKGEGAGGVSTSISSSSTALSDVNRLADVADRFILNFFGTSEREEEGEGDEEALECAREL